MKSEANWGMLANGPRTRKRDGEWAPVRMRSFKLSGRDFWHQTLAAPNQNNWRTLKESRNTFVYHRLNTRLICKFLLVIGEAGQTLFHLIPILETGPLACSVFDICSVGFFNAAVIGNILSLSVDAVNLHPFKRDKFKSLAMI